MAKMETLPDDIIYEVLLKLPVKSLIRFKCVSKPWCVLICNPLFAKTHYLKQSTTHHNQTFFIIGQLFSILTEKSFARCPLFYPREWALFYPREDDEFDNYDADYDTVDSDAIIDFSIPSMSLGLRSVIVGTCDGLICIHCENSDRFFVLNPTTRDCKVLSHPGYPGYHRHKTLFLYEDTQVFGFGYNSLLDDYNIVTIFTREKDYGNKSSVARVGSLRTNSWKKIQDCPYELFPQIGVYVSGAIHWINDDMNAIVAFDLVEEEFKEVPLIHKSKPVDVETVGVHKDCLCMLEIEYGDSSLILWTMVEYGVRESWTKLVVIPKILTGIYSIYPQDAEKGKFLVMKHKSPIWYNFKEETFEFLRIKHLSKQILLKNPFQLIKYEESLISPLVYGNNEIDD